MRVVMHFTCRNNVYPRSSVRRFPVPDELVPWSKEYTDYMPPVYTAPHVNGQSWADADIVCNNFKPKWNQLDGNVNRVSYAGCYDIQSGYPLNPIGRTGLRGRGLLGRWGPNHAADPIVTRWKRDEKGCVIQDTATQKNILQIVAIQRHDNKMWALPGGMVDPGEKVSETVKREFMEEALNSFDDRQMMERFFEQHQEIYKGYVDDYRNTDNAWIETAAFHFHDDDGQQVGKLKLSAGDDARDVKWVDVDSQLQLHANHINIVGVVVNNLNAHW